MKAQRRHSMKTSLVLLQILLLLLTTTGCGTMLRGTHQTVQLDVQPPGTQVSVYRWDGELLAGPQVSPGTMKVPRPVGGQPYLVRASRDGYCPRYWLTSGMPEAPERVLLTIVAVVLTIPFVINALVDGSTGGCCSMHPGHIEGSLEGNAACAQ
jgi:hypothetical protein